ncbi:sigma-70 family RNA polymerase sigma factor [Nakamurella silvestris]|nr:sigma-70 family RNA polymerase sigma factor [Nakamurella silvestris]
MAGTQAYMNMEQSSVTQPDPSLPVTADLYLLYGEDLLRYARRRVLFEDADDVVSEVFLVVARGGKVPGGSAALPWLYAVAYRIVLKSRTKRWRSVRLRERLESLPARTGTEVDALVASTALVNSMIDRLPERDAELLRLVVFEDLDVPAAADILGISPGATHTRLHRIRRKMQAWFESHAISPLTDNSRRP